MDSPRGILARDCPLRRRKSFRSKTTTNPSKHEHGNAEQTFTPMKKLSRQRKKFLGCNNPKSGKLAKVWVKN